jgi:hypothetical protein
MLQNLSERIRLCYERAAEAKQHAEETNDAEAKAGFLNTEKRWLLLARSYDLSERLKDFTRAIPDHPDAVRKNVTEHAHSEPPLRNWEENLQTVLSNTPFMLTRCSPI